MDILKKRINDIYSKNIKQRKVDNDNLNKYGLQGITLRDYQVDGVNWLIERYHRDHGCILADEMGLGKTCQTISFLVYLFGSGETAGPHLILSPLSVLSNWHSELTRFAPKLHCVVYQGTKEQRSKLAMEMTKSEKIINVVLTTYEICLKDESFLRRFGEWRTLVVDEAHRLKNSESLLYKVLQEFDIDHRILLTGTPIQNNMQELYSLLRFTTPGIFKEKYMQTFLDTYASETALQAKGLQSLLKPFLLRRIKSEVVRDLPPRSEVILYHGMSATQKRYYRALLAKDTEAFDNPNKTTKTRLMNILVQLRKCVNHPYLFDGVEPEPFVLGEHLVEASGKLFLLDQLLLHLHSHGHKVLLFSQMTRVLDILQDYLGYRGYNYERLDGSVRGEERYLAVQNFNKDDDTFIFLLSTRAGGVGLNLVAADTVIFMDSDFNPQNDLQAAARAHRIGQTRPVKIVRLVGRSTVEEIVLKRASAKLKLTHDVIGSHKFSTVDDKADLVAEDSFQLSDILKFGVDKLFSSDESSIEDVDFDTLLGGSKDGEWMSDEVAGATQAQSLGVEEDEVEETEAASGSASMYVYEGTDYKNAASTEDQKAFDELIAVEQAMQEASLSGTGRPMRRGGDGSLVGELPSLTKTRVPLTAEQLEERKKKKEEAAERRQKMEEDAVVRREAARKKRLLALWTANSYSSLNVTLDSEGEEVEDEEEGASGGLLKLDMENEEDGTSAQDIKYVVGDVTRPQQKDDLSAITVHCVDDSGGWGSGGVFSAISRHAPNIEKHYEHAGEMKDLSLGDAHLLPVEGSSDPQHYYAIVVAQHRDRKNNLSGIKLTALSDSLQRIYKAAIDLKASVHFPRIGHRTPGFNWYGTERLIRKHLSRKGIPTYIYYYPRKQQKADPEQQKADPEKQKADPEQGTSSSLKRKKCDVDSSSQSESDTESPPKHVRFSFMGKTSPVTKSTSTEEHSTKACTLPNFMLGVQVAFHTSVKAMDVQSLRRYLVAYGGKLPTELTANTSHLCVSAENGSIGGEEELSQIAKDNPAVIIVSTNWLKASFRKQQQVNVAPYIHPKAK